MAAPAVLAPPVPPSAPAPPAAPAQRPLHRPIGPWPARARRLASAAAWYGRDLAAAGIFLACTIAFFWPTLTQGLIPYENDTRIFYYPLFVRLGQAVKAGLLPLWSPQLFGGYPVFADGEAGALYPFHLLALLFLPVNTAFTLLRPLRFFQAALFTYLFCRTTGIGRFGALIGAIAFAFGGFAIAQLHHTNIGTASVWLPLALAFGELALRLSGRRRYLFALLAGVAFSLQGLVIHIQVVLLSGVTFAAYCGFRAATEQIGHGDGPAAWIERRRAAIAARRRWVRLPHAGRFGSTTASRLCLAAAITAIAGGVGGGLAAVQLLPLYELGTFSFRGNGVDYAFASQYSLPPAQLLTLLLPDFFVVNGQYWGLWSHWEVFVYVGIAPLLLAFVGLVLSSRRLPVFFALLGAVSLVLALGEYSPGNVHHLLLNVPGFSVLRAPGRFTFLVTLSAAMLAAFGADALWREFSPPRAVQVALSGTPRRLWTEARLGVTLVGLQAVAVAAPLALVSAAAYVQGHRDLTAAWLQSTFVRMRGFDPRFNVEQLYQYLGAGLDLTNADTQRQLALIVATVAVIVAWDRARSAGFIWQTLLVLLVAVDLIGLGQRFHPLMPAAALGAPSGAGTYLAAQTGLFRVYTQKGAVDEPDRLLVSGLAEANGYSSLEPSRHEQYAAKVEYAPNRLLDLLNARYYVVKNRYNALASFNWTEFDPALPLLSGTGQNGAARNSFRFDGAAADSLRIVSTLRWAEMLKQGEPVVRITVTDAGGRQQVFRMLAGVQTADWAIERPDLKGKIPHQMAQVAFTWQQRDGASPVYPGHLYYAEFPFGGEIRIRQIDVEFLHPTAQIEIDGMSLYDDATKDVIKLDLNSLQKYTRVYADRDETVYENRDYLPRAFLVPSAVVERPGDELLTQMAYGDFSPERFVILEEQFDTSRLPPPPPASQPIVPVRFDKPAGTDITSGPGRVRITTAADDELRFEITANQNAMLLVTDVMYPGWRAYLDGQETTIYRGDDLFRTVFVPAGQHTIQMLYRPRSFRLGLMVSLVTTLGTLAALAALTFGALRGRAAR